MSPTVTAEPRPASTTSKPAGERIFNFSAGPGCLPDDVLRQVQQDVWNIGGSGIGILEHSHRGRVVDKIFEECEATIRRVGNVPKNYQILFLTGGASAQNHMIPLNFLGAGKEADYLITGYWAQKTYDQAAKMASWPGGQFGKANIAATSKDQNHSYIPGDDQIKYSKSPAYIHYCSNNTIFGTEWFREPKAPAGVPLICDASSHFYSRPIDFSKYTMVYAGSQKNMGPAGVTLCIIRDDLIEQGSKNIPDLLQYRTFVPELSRPNTPPVFAIYVMGLIAKWIEKSGGLAAMQKYNQEKAGLIYSAMDAGFYKGHARKDSRSLMNITFRCTTPELDDLFVAEAKKQGMDGLKGHRATGGMRASTYNAFPRAGCAALAEFMRDFAKKHG
jgi:phosphoserine aminotransferase